MKRTVRPRHGTVAGSLVIEATRYAEGHVVLTVSIPGREGTAVHVWADPVPWDDCQTRLLALMGEFLLLTGGVQLGLALEPPTVP